MQLAIWHREVPQLCPWGNYFISEFHAHLYNGRVRRSRLCEVGTPSVPCWHPLHHHAHGEESSSVLSLPNVESSCRSLKRFSPTSFAGGMLIIQLDTIYLVLSTAGLAHRAVWVWASPSWHSLNWWQKVARGGSVPTVSGGLCSWLTEITGSLYQIGFTFKIWLNQIEYYILLTQSVSGDSLCHSMGCP